MLDKQKDIDAIVVATPDHMHAVIALAAMDLNKHVYVQKPLCWSVEEARALAKKAKEKPSVVTQMGNQGHSSDGSRTGYEYIRGGAIGDVREVHVWTNRPLGFWPQGIPRPAPLEAGRGAAAAAFPLRTCHTADSRRAVPRVGSHAVDALGSGISSSACRRCRLPPDYHPHHWRGWVDWGQGALGDMGAHLIDHPFKALNLGLPTVIETFVDAVQRRLLSARDHDLLPVPGTRRHAGRAADLVRRRTDATAARGARRGSPERRGRHHLRGAARAR